MGVIAITGAGGMIGRHLVDALRPSGTRLRVLLLPKEPVPSNFQDVEIERGDIRNREDLSRLMAGADTVFHLAALVGRDANQAHIQLAREVNVEGTRNVVEEAKRQQVSRLVFLSTCCVYGLYGTLDELVNEQSALAPLAFPYDLSKTEAEQLVMGEDTGKLAWSILEVPVALGGEYTAHKPTILSMVRMARLRLVPLPVSGATWVNYAFGGDVADALVLLSRHPSAVGQKFIYSESRPLLDFVRLIAKQIGRRVTAVPLPNVVLDVAARKLPAAAVLANRRRFSAEKIRTLLDFKPQVGLEAGLERTLTHYRSIGLIAEDGQIRTKLRVAARPGRSAHQGPGMRRGQPLIQVAKRESATTVPADPPIAPLRVFVLTPGVGGMGGISRLMDWIDEEISDRPSAEVAITCVSTRGDTRYLRPLVFLSSVARVAFACVSGRCDVLHVNLASFGSTYRKLLLSGVARLTGTPYVVHLHGGAYREFWASRPTRVASLVAGIFRNASSVIVLGSSWAGLIADRVPQASSRITVLPNAVPRPRYVVRRIEDGTPITIAFVGRLNAAKGVPQLIKALGAIKAEGGWNAVLAGDGDVKGTTEAVQALGLSDRVSISGWLKPEEVEQLWQRAGIFVLPSFIENLPLSIIEAFSHGVPIVCTPVGSVPELVEDGRTGLIVPVGDSEALGRALKQLLRDPALRARLAANGRADFDARFELSGYVDRLVKIWVDAARPPPVKESTISPSELTSHR